MTVSMRILVVSFDPPTNAYVADCLRCGKRAFSLSAEVVVFQGLTVPALVPHKCLGPEE